ncbi:MAG: fibronectin type III domain-containing protein [Geobacteraceae bacterium]
MKDSWRLRLAVLWISLLCLVLWGCGGSVARYDPGAPAVPSGLTVIATGDGQVSLAWSAAAKAGSYIVYYSTSPGVTSATGTKFGVTSSTNTIVTGLTNGTQYYFVVSSANSTSESGVSNEVSATPAIPAAFDQSDLTGIWRFNILVSGSSSGWMRGTILVDASGAVTINPFLDNTGGTAAPAYLFPVLLINSTGQVRDALNEVDAHFKGAMGGSQRKIIVGTSVTDTGAHLFVVLQKHDPSVVFSDSGSLAGFGSSAGGARRFSYSQLSSGTLKEWEFGIGQIGGDRTVKYSTFTAPSNPATPGDKATTLSITSDGIVTESGSAISPQPSVLIPAGVMSDDTSLIVATATDSVNPGKYVLRIYSMINIVPSDTNTFTLADLAGSYSIESLIVGTTAKTASGMLSADGTTGAVTFDSYLDSTNNTTPPAGFTLAISSDGILSSAADATLHGKLAYNKDIAVTTKTESAGVYSLSVALKSY